jgi:hypothetical protein
LTLAEVRELAVLHRAGEEERVEQRLEVLLERSHKRVENRIAELSATRKRILAFRASRAHAVEAVEASASGA